MKSVIDLVTSLKTYFLGKIADEAATRSAMGAKNMVPYPYYNGDSRDTNGILFTVNSDGSITISGQATADAYFRLTYNTGDVHVPLVAGKSYILSASGKADVAFLLRDSSTSNVASARATDATYNCTTAGNYDVILGVDNGADYSTPITVYPMLRIATDVNSDYQPYAKTNKELTDASNLLNADLSNEVITRAKNGAHNFWDIDNNAVFWDNAGGSSSYGNNLLTVNCAAQIYSGVFYAPELKSLSCFKNLAGVPVKLSFDYKGDSSFEGRFGLEANPATNITANYQHYNVEIQDITEYVGGLIFYSVDSSSAHTIYVKNFMVTLASDPYTEYTPYAPTNQELAGVVPTMTKNGASNLYNLNSEKLRNISGVTVEILPKGYRIYNSTSGTWKDENFHIVGLDKNTDYILSYDATVTSGAARVSIGYYTGSTPTLIKDSYGSGHHEIAFNSGSYDYLYTSIACVTSTAGLGDVTYDNFQIRLATDPSSEYTPYAMTNRELTEMINNLKVVKVGKITTTGDNITPNTQYNFDITDNNIKAGDMIFSQLILEGTASDNVWLPRQYASDGLARLVLKYTGGWQWTNSIIVGFTYVIVRAV